MWRPRTADMLGSEKQMKTWSWCPAGRPGAVLAVLLLAVLPRASVVCRGADGHTAVSVSPHAACHCDHGVKAEKTTDSRLRGSMCTDELHDWDYEGGQDSRATVCAPVPLANECLAPPLLSGRLDSGVFTPRTHLQRPPPVGTLSILRTIVLIV